MSVAYSAVQWNRHKRIYDLCLAGGVVGYLAIFILVGGIAWRGAEAISPPVLLIRATGTCAYLMLHLILSIGPLARMSPRFAPLLYNRRHFGVTMFLVAAIHGGLNLGFYHGFGVVNPFVSLLTSDANYGSFRAFPFQPLGAAALLILFLMAATSHDFWLKNLGPSLWKALHMGVYFAYTLLVFHVVLGVLQSERHALFAVATLGGAALMVFLHISAALIEKRRPLPEVAEPGWIRVDRPETIPDGRARLVCPHGGERIAVFRDGDCLSAISNVCAHQGGPLGEGKIVGGCVTCPWHGYQYIAESGSSPPPFTERIETYLLRADGDRLLLCLQPLPPGTPVEPVRWKGGSS